MLFVDRIVYITMFALYLILLLVAFNIIHVCAMVLCVTAFLVEWKYYRTWITWTRDLPGKAKLKRLLIFRM